MEGRSEEGKKAWMRERKPSQPCSRKLGMEKQIKQKKMSELALKGEKKGRFCFILLTLGLKKKKKINLEEIQ